MWLLKWFSSVRSCEYDNNNEWTYGMSGIGAEEIVNVGDISNVVLLRKKRL